MPILPVNETNALRLGMLTSVTRSQTQIFLSVLGYEFLDFSEFESLTKLTLLHSFSHGREHVSKEMNEQAQQNRKVLCRNRVSVKFLDWLFETQE